MGERERQGSLGIHWEFRGVRICPSQGAEGSLGQRDWDTQAGFESETGMGSKAELGMGLGAETGMALGNEAGMGSKAELD